MRPGRVEIQIEAENEMKIQDIRSGQSFMKEYLKLPV